MERHLDGQVRSATGKLTRRLANFASLPFSEPIDPKSPFPETAIDDVAGCLQYEGEVKTLDEGVKEIYEQ